MKNIIQLNDYNIVTTVAQVGDDVVLSDRVIEIGNEVEDVLGKMYRGGDIGFTELDYIEIIQKENNIISFSMFDYEDKIVVFNDEIIIKINQEIFTYTMENGILEIEIENTTGEPIIIETMNENVRNEVLVIE
ncbi:hypothetical protein SAMN05660297_02734 [Natronincola peptidivorans]|uniref:Uncharacterized protein n=1 Tax=Natronincola peptidivorans TaxID=426128 RepID=A0A1I0FBH2_9FIRM|nr:hypothetical protein [Natronincola peptidivorans]SET55203.1 hypothetical protein SAMN05660297_02734 [Natronincola peptidivorans]